jgi:hypothetical protein
VRVVLDEVVPHRPPSSMVPEGQELHLYRDLDDPSGKRVGISLAKGTRLEGLAERMRLRAEAVFLEEAKR